MGSVPGSGRSPGEGLGIQSSLLAWRIPCTEEPGGLQSIGLQRATEGISHTRVYNGVTLLYNTNQHILNQVHFGK